MSRTLLAIIILLATSALVFAQTTDFAGRYASDGVFVELRPASRGYEGVMHEGDQSFPLQGQVREGVSRGGKYILTSNPNFNPNVEMRGDWVEMKPTP